MFCDGDFWHGYQYAKKKKPGKKFWRDKIERNIERDRRISRKLRRSGYSVIRLWEDIRGDSWRRDPGRVQEDSPRAGRGRHLP